LLVQRKVVLDHCVDASGEVRHRRRALVERSPRAELEPQRLLPVARVRHTDDAGRALGDPREDADDAGYRDALTGCKDLDKSA
jgi:hypothetical protein